MPKAIRILVYEGPQIWLDQTLERSYVQPDRTTGLMNKATIKEVYRDTFTDIDILPEITIDKEEINV